MLPTLKARSSSWPSIALLLLFLGSGVLVPGAHPQTPARTITIHARKFAFVPSAITLKKGETVKLVLVSDDVLHGLAVRGLPIRAGITPGHPTEVIVTPAEVGDFAGVCSVYCGAGHRNMEFVVHVVQ